MKKIISVAVALCIAITSLFTSVYAMADSKVTSGDIKKKLNDTAIYLLSEKKADFDVENVKSLVSYINAGIDVNDYKDEFTKSVKENLDSNSGKIIAVVGYDENNNWAPIKGESAGVYANVITALDYFGFDVKNYEGINLVENFKNVKLNKDHENQYLFSSIFAVAEKYGLADTLKTAQNFLLNNFYEFGTGSTYYTSTDSDAQLVVALAPYSNKYKSVIDDTLNCMESYKADGGYLYNLDKVYNYNTGELEDPVISGNSTGLALAAYSAMNDFDKAQKIYNEIVNSFECKDVKGAYAYTAGGDENALATADVFTYLNTIIFILVIAALVQLIELFLKKYVPKLYQALGVYLPLITTNCAVLGVALTNVQENNNFITSVITGFGTAVGFALAIIIMAGIRERIENNDFPKAFKGTPAVLLTACLMAIAFYGFGSLK